VVIGTIAIVDDVSERVASERQLRQQIESADAARRVAEEAVRVDAVEMDVAVALGPEEAPIGHRARQKEHGRSERRHARRELHV